MKGVLAHPPVYEVIRPESVGNRRRHSDRQILGPVVVRAKLAEYGLSATDEEIRTIISEIERQAADRHAPHWGGLSGHRAAGDRAGLTPCKKETH